ncbi:hypothetical protein [Campylobacter sp.]|uniref:hypothetical protein n=1 Tax=Campylobacter sp. TaxID=205 RepID=UPI002A75E8F8|nr:hypothetical protein [Campylobacter sp.]MDY3245895.1 hypothetical protein [Campylobacter sp.]
MWGYFLGILVFLGLLEFLNSHCALGFVVAAVKRRLQDCVFSVAKAQRRLAVDSRSRQ